jgi:hypothetical protein
MRALVDEHYRRAEVKRVVPDNLSTHTAAALHGVFEPIEAHGILCKPEIRCLSRRTSWFNMRKIGSDVLKQQCPAVPFASRIAG